MTWIYEQATGRLMDPSGAIAATGYAGGNCGKNPEGKNNPAMQDCKAIGPLPVGRYTLSTPQLQSHLGPFAIPLIPAPGNEMFGRSGFFVHGDSIEHPGAASEGCIIVPRTVRGAMWESNDHSLEVISGEE